VTLASDAHGTHVHRVSLWLVGLLLPAVLLGSSEIGYWAGRHVERDEDDTRMSHGQIWQAAVLALLGLLIGFSFAMAVTRFDGRRQLILDEANAIGTTYLRTRPLDEPGGEQLRALLRRYVQARVAFYDAGADRARIDQATRESESLQQQIWAPVVAFARADARSVTAGLLMQSTNDMIDLEAKRLAALDNHVPATVLAIIVLVAAVAMGAIGYTSGLSRRRFLFGMLGMPLLIAAVVLLVLDIDHPRLGLTRVGQKSMLRVQQSL
jgi:hypothetical protein